MLSVFDIIGPVMIGPSSSHTAGAARIGGMARAVFQGEIERAEIGLYGSFAKAGEGHGTRFALVAGLLGMEADDPRIPQSEDLAREAGMAVEWGEARLGPDAHPNSAVLRLFGGGRSVEVRASSVGGGRALINAIDGCEVNISGDLPTLVFFHADEVGTLAGITGRVAAEGVNIAFLRTYRREGSRDAVTEMAMDDPMPVEAREDLLRLEPVERVIYISPIGRRGAQKRAPRGRAATIVFESLGEAAREADERGCTLGRLALEYEAAGALRDRDAVTGQMRAALAAMRESVEQGRARSGMTRSGLTGEEASLFAAAEGRTLGGGLVFRVQRDALAVAGLNAAMGRIVAAPTGGSCGILPGALLNVAKDCGATEDEVVDALFAAAGVGLVIARRASLSGAKHGCQAECGAASAMAAAACAQALGLRPGVVEQAAALALKNALGLTCDPVGGLVEAPCVKRNAFFALHAIAAVNLALAGMASVAPFDEVVDAMRETGELMSPLLRESGEGGLARTPAALAWLERRR